MTRSSVLRLPVVGDKGPRRIGAVGTHAKQRIEPRNATGIPDNESRHDFTFAHVPRGLCIKADSLLGAPDALLRTDLTGAGRGAQR